MASTSHSSPFRFNFPHKPAISARKRRKLNRTDHDFNRHEQHEYFASPQVLQSPTAGQEQQSRTKQFTGHQCVQQSRHSTASCDLGDAFAFEHRSTPQPQVLKPRDKEVKAKAAQKYDASGASSPVREQHSGAHADEQTHRHEEQENTPPSTHIQCKTADKRTLSRSTETSPSPPKRPRPPPRYETASSQAIAPRPPPRPPEHPSHSTPKPERSQHSDLSHFNATPRFSLPATRPSPSTFKHPLPPPPRPSSSHSHSTQPPPRPSSSHSHFVFSPPQASQPTQPTRPRFALPPSHDAILPTSDPDAAPRISNAVLAEVFSPHKNRKGQRYVSGGFAEQMRGWVLDVGVSGVGMEGVRGLLGEMAGGRAAEEERTVA